jgi:hypothetical protein
MLELATIGLQALPFLDCAYMIGALEYNRYAIRHRLDRAKQGQDPNPPYTACYIGYKENRETFAACPQSHKAHAKGCAVYLSPCSTVRPTRMPT